MKSNYFDQVEKEFEKKRKSFHDTYNGGHNEPDSREAFHHGMDVGFNAGKKFIRQAFERYVEDLKKKLPAKRNIKDPSEFWNVHDQGFNHAIDQVNDNLFGKK